MSVQETYDRTLKAEGFDRDEIFQFNKANDYTLSNDIINDVYERNLEISERKNLTEDETMDSFVMELVDRGCDQDEAEEIAEIHARTAGEFFASESPDDDTPPDEYEDDEDEEETEGEEKEADFFEV